MAKKVANKFDEKSLSKGHQRKLGALRKSLGKEIADKAFAEWLKDVVGEQESAVDKNATAIAEVITPLLKAKKISIPRGGFFITRWRDQVVVKAAGAKK